MSGDKGQTLIELIIILPVVFALVWLGFDLVILYRDEYLLDYATFHSLRIAAEHPEVSDYKVRATVLGLLALGLKGTSTYYPAVSRVSVDGGRIGLKASLVRHGEFAWWPPVDTQLSTYWEAK
ncbi:MAG: pilus assembly protein [Firmicutes bacterium]|nr:pilus assembly protein [Bacillota bacterium]